MRGIRRKADGKLRSFWEPSEGLQEQVPDDETEEVVELKSFELNRDLVQYADATGNVTQKPLEYGAVAVTGFEGLREGFVQNILNKPHNANLTVGDLQKLLNMASNGEIFRRSNG